MICSVPETGSTNADLSARLRAGEMPLEGDWLVADRQSAGHGRQGRDWFDGAGNFMGSTVVRLRPADPAPQTLALVAGLAVHEAISACLPTPHRAMLKWPNDVMIDGAKLAGILLEREGDTVIVGIGVNLASAPALPDRQAIALSAFGSPPERDAFAAELARLFALEIERWRNSGLAPIIARWLDAAHPSGTPLKVSEPGQAALNGVFAGLSVDGALQLRLDDGTTRAIHAGETQIASPRQ